MFKKLFNWINTFYIVPLGILAGFAFWFTYDIYTLKKAFIHTDFITCYYPYRLWFAQRLLHGEFPLWNPFWGIGTTSEIWATFPVDFYTILEVIFGPQYHYFLIVQLLFLLFAVFFVFRRLEFKSAVAAAGVLLFFMSPWVSYFYFYFVKTHSFIAHILLFLFIYQWAKTNNYKYLIFILWTTILSMFGTKPEFWFYQIVFFTFFSFIAGFLLNPGRFIRSLKISLLAILPMFIGLLAHTWQFNLLIRIMGNASRTVEHSLANIFSPHLYHNLSLSLAESPLLKIFLLSILLYLGLTLKRLLPKLGLLLLGAITFRGLSMGMFPIIAVFIKNPFFWGALISLGLSFTLKEKIHWKDYVETSLLFLLFIYYWCRPERGDLGELEIIRTAPVAFKILVSTLVWLGCTQFNKSKLVKLAYCSIFFIFIMRDQGQIILAYLAGILWIPTRDNYIIDFAVSIVAVTGLTALESSIASILKFDRTKWWQRLSPIPVISIIIIVFSAASNFYYAHALMTKVPSNYPYYRGIPKVKEAIQELKDSPETRIFFIPTNSISFSYDFGSSLLENVGEVSLYSSFVPNNYKEWSIYRNFGIRPEQKWGGYPNEYSEKTISRLPKRNTLGYNNTAIYLANLIALPPIDKNTLKLLGVSHVLKFVPDPRHNVQQFAYEIKDLGIQERKESTGMEYPHTTGNLSGSLFIARIDTPLPRAFLLYNVTEDGLKELTQEMNPQVSDQNNFIKTKSHTFPLNPARIEKYQAENVSITVNAKENAYLVLADLYHPFWHARLDGEEAKITPAFHIFRAVKVPQGRHRINFYCKVPYFKTSIFISGFIIFLSILATILYFRFRFKSTK